MKQKHHLPKGLIVSFALGIVLCGAVGVTATTIAKSTTVYAPDSNSPMVQAAASTKTVQQTETTTSSATVTTKTVAPDQSIVTSSAVATTQVTAAATLHGRALYVDPAQSQQGQLPAIASQPTSVWLGAWSGDVRAVTDTVVTAAAAQGKLATFVVYNIPARDCGSYSAGGANSSDAYKVWIREIAAGIGDREAIVVLEPDALAQLDCLSASGQTARLANLSDAVAVLAAQTKAYVYIDAGHSAWQSTSTMVTRLQKANVAQATGFSLNVSNFQTTSASLSYGNQIAIKLGKTFVIDTSRNGNGSNSEWCNPRGRALGERPTTNLSGRVDAYLWIKTPGESDGTCNGGPSAGTWWPEYAAELVQNSSH